jgi:hypothetical protein
LRFRSRTSTFRFTITRSTIALSAPALAVAAIAGGGWLTGSAAAQPVRAAHSVSSAQAAGAAATGTTSIGTDATRTTITGTSPAGLLTTHAVLAATGSHRLGRNREIAWRMMSHRFGWRPKYQFRSLNLLWDRESGWNVHASNPYSGAYGIPQAVPGSKMATAGPDWVNSARTQIRWGLRYIRSRYGKPRRAWAHECAYGWY